MLIKGDIHTDERGTLSFVNEFNLKINSFFLRRTGICDDSSTTSQLGYQKIYRFSLLASLKT